VTDLFPKLYTRANTFQPQQDSLKIEAQVHGELTLEAVEKVEILRSETLTDE
jgi:hypothetical protein